MLFEINTRAGHRVAELDGRPLFTFAPELESDVVRVLSAAAAHEIITGRDARLIIDGRAKVGKLDELLGPAAA